MSDLAAEIKASFAWAYEMGIGAIIDDAIKRNAALSEVTALVRESPQWEAVFPGFYRTDGSKNYRTEAEYLQAVSDYRNVLKDYGMYDEAQDNPQNYVAWMELQVDPNELQQRFQTYRALESGSQGLRDAFYVYGGLNVTVDDLYESVVDPTRGAELQAEYDQATAGGAFSYETFLNRVSEVATRRLTEQMGWLERQGYAPSSAVQNLLGAQPEQVRQFLDIIYTAGNNSTGGYMSLEELVTTYTYAMLGSAASEQGLVLPSQEKLERYVQAGVTRTRAMEAYGAYSVAQHGLAGMASRANIRNIDQGLFEEAQLLHQGDAQEVLSKATGGEKALGKAGGGFSTQLDEDGRLVQRGRR